MDYNKLKTFLIVAEEMSVTRAAVRLLRTQSAVTQQLQLLEEDLGVALLHRKKARIYLTSEGESVFRVASESYSRVEAHLADLLSRTQSVEGVIRIGMIPEFGSELVLRSIEELKARYPRVDFHITYGTASEAVEKLLLQNEVDFGLLVPFRDKKLFRTKPTRATSCFGGFEELSGQARTSEIVQRSGQSELDRFHRRSAEFQSMAKAQRKSCSAGVEAQACQLRHSESAGRQGCCHQGTWACGIANTPHRNRAEGRQARKGH